MTPHPRRHQRLPAAAGRHPDLRGRAAGPPSAGLASWCSPPARRGPEYDAALPYPVVRRPTGDAAADAGHRPRRRRPRPAARLRQRLLRRRRAAGAARPGPARRPASATSSAPRTATRPAGLRCPGRRQLLQRIAGGLDVLTYISEYTRSRLEPALGGRTRLAQLSPGVDVERFTPGRRRRGRPPAVRARLRRRSWCACPGSSPARARTSWWPAGRGCSPGIPTPGCCWSAAGPTEASLRRAVSRLRGCSDSVVLTGPVAPDGAARPLRGRRRLRHALPHPPRGSGRRGARDGLPRGRRLRPAGGGGHLGRRAGGRAGGRHRARGRTAVAASGRRRDQPACSTTRPGRARWARPAGHGSSSAGRGRRSPRRSRRSSQPGAGAPGYAA